MQRLTSVNNILAFVTVAREGSVSRAAEVLNLTQPAVSHQIKRLGEDTGSVLFTRTATGLVLTRDGAALRTKAEQVLQALADFDRSAERRIGQIGGRLRLGTIVDPEFIRLGQFLVQLRETYSELKPELTHGVSGDVLERLKRNKLDAGFFLSGPDPYEMLPPDSDGQFVFTKLADFRYRVIAPAGWRSEIEGRDWPDLARLPWIGTPTSSVHRRLLDNIFRGLGCEQNVVAQVDQEISMIEMVRSGMGLSLCRESLALHNNQAYGVELSDVVSVDASLSFATLASRKDTPTLRAVLDLLNEIWEFSS
ncbi:LysR family transcriptional regulator [Roseibium algae]|uniref:LysR family transcriptional regulator n=1 Tax=Roseibium algae TaxID=3123038 RepID=A0ABU8TI36_9HYPH